VYTGCSFIGGVDTAEAPTRALLPFLQIPKQKKATSPAQLQQQQVLITDQKTIHIVFMGLLQAFVTAFNCMKQLKNFSSAAQSKPEATSRS
jgi:hypothetical protein